MEKLKYGDRVRVTIEGTVEDVAGDLLYVADHEMDRSDPRVTVEALPLEEPQTYGAVVRDGDGDLWARTAHGKWSCLAMADVEWLTWPELTDEFGPLEQADTKGGA